MTKQENNHTPALILTLTLDEQASHYFTTLRKQYFPPERNFLDAHLTLFHQLPVNQHTVVPTIRQAALQQTVLTLQVTEVVSTGNGVAYRIENKELLSIHDYLQQQWRDKLTAQDRQRLWPHVTVQNKVPSAVAKSLLEQLRTGFTPFTCYGTGFTLWEYMGGPWKFRESFPFKAAGAV